MKIYQTIDNNTYYIFCGDINSFIVELEILLSDLNKEYNTTNISSWYGILDQLKQGNNDRYTEFNNLITKYGFIILKNSYILFYSSKDNYEDIYSKYINDRNKEVINDFEKIIKDYEESINRK